MKTRFAAFLLCILSERTIAQEPQSLDSIAAGAIVEQLRCNRSPNPAPVLEYLAQKGLIQAAAAVRLDSVSCWDFQRAVDLDGLHVGSICAAEEDELVRSLNSELLWRGPGTSPGTFIEFGTLLPKAVVESWMRARNIPLSAKREAPAGKMSVGCDKSLSPPPLAYASDEKIAANWVLDEHGIFDRETGRYIASTINAQMYVDSLARIFDVKKNVDGRSMSGDILSYVYEFSRDGRMYFSFAFDSINYTSASLINVRTPLIKDRAGAHVGIKATQVPGLKWKAKCEIGEGMPSCESMYSSSVIYRVMPDNCCPDPISNVVRQVPINEIDIYPPFPLQPN